MVDYTLGAVRSKEEVDRVVYSGLKANLGKFLINTITRAIRKRGIFLSVKWCEVNDTPTMDPTKTLAMGYYEIHHDTGKVSLHRVTESAKAITDLTELTSGKKSAGEQINVMLSWLEKVAWEINYVNPSYIKEAKSRNLTDKDCEN